MTPAPLAPVHHVVQPYARFVVIHTDSTINVYEPQSRLTPLLMTHDADDALKFVAKLVRAGEWANVQGLDGTITRVNYTAKEQ